MFLEPAYTAYIKKAAEEVEKLQILEGLDMCRLRLFNAASLENYFRARNSYRLV